MFELLNSGIDVNFQNEKSDLRKRYRRERSEHAVDTPYSYLIDSQEISSARVITVSNLKDTATWEYSIDDGVNWSAPLAPTVTEITLPDEADSTYLVKVRQTNASNDSADNQPLTSVSDMVEFTVDTSAPFVEVISASSAEQTITIAYNEALDPSSVPATTDYEITQSGNDLTVSEVKFDSENSNNLLLLIDSGLINGAVSANASPLAFLLINSVPVTIFPHWSLPPI